MVIGTPVTDVEAAQRPKAATDKHPSCVYGVAQASRQQPLASESATARWAYAPGDSPIGQRVRTHARRAWRGPSQRPTSSYTSLTSYVVQEIIVANNTVWFSCPIAGPTRRPGSRDVPVMWLALSEFRYCRHNS